MAENQSTPKKAPPAEETYRAARTAALSAALHADEVAAREGWQLGEGLWQDEASDHLYDQRAELGEHAYQLALELIGEERRRRNG